MKSSFCLLALMLTMVQGAWADESAVHNINDQADWDAFCSTVNDDGHSYSGETVRLNVDITSTTIVGTEEHPFVGTFDGDGHRLDVHIKSSSAFAAPFGTVGNATFLNLHVDGAVTTTMESGADHTAGLIGKAAGIVTINNVCVSAWITGHTYYGGFIGHGGGSSTLATRIVMAGCVFDGMLRENKEGYTEHAGGFIGWGDYMNIKMTNCMFDGDVDISQAQPGHHNFHPIGYYTATATRPEVSLDNVYYLKAPSAQSSTNNGTAISNDAKMAHTISAGTDVTALDFSGPHTEYAVADIISYEKGMKYDSDFYAGNGDEVSLMLDHAPAATGMHFAGYTVSGGGTIKEQSEKSAVLSMSDNDQTISAQYEDNPQGHVFFADGTETGWSVTSGSSARVGDPVTIGYSGEHRVKSATAKPHRMAAEATAADKGKLICCHGHIHDYGKDTLCHAERHAMIVYVANGTGMALGTTDVTDKGLTWNYNGTNNEGLSARQWCDRWNTIRGVPNAQWRLPSKDDFDAMMGADGADGFENLRDGFEKVGGTNIKKTRYWSSTDAGYGHKYGYHFSLGEWDSYSPMFPDNYVRAVLVFSLKSATQSPTFDITMTGTKSGDTYNYSGTFDMPEYDVEVSTEMYYKLSQTATNNAATYGTKKDVYLERTLQTDGWNTFCAPFDISPIPTGWTVKKLGSTLYDETKKVLTFNFDDETTKMTAGTPYLVKVESTVTDPIFENITQVYSGEGQRVGEPSSGMAGAEVYTANPTATAFATFTPVLTQEYIEGSKAKLLLTDGDKLTCPTHSDFINAFRAYFLLTDDAVIDANDYVLNFDFPNIYSWDGDGTEANPYIIMNTVQFIEMQEAINGSYGEKLQGKYFRQGANITFDKTIANEYTPGKAFMAHYDGAGFVISGVNIEVEEPTAWDGPMPAREAALFGTLDGNATIKNVIVKNSTFKGSDTGVIATSVFGDAIIENCHVLKDVTVISESNAGGIAGAVNGEGAKVTGCTSQATVKGYSEVGGITSLLTSGSVRNNIALGSSITGSENVHAVVGKRNDGTVENCYFTAPTLEDANAKLMPNVEDDNTDFLTLLAARDNYLKEAAGGLEEEDISYDLTMNGREYGAVKNDDDKWSRRAYTLSLPFDMEIPEELQEDVLVYKMLEIDTENKEFVFTNDFPILKVGVPYIIVFNKGSLTFQAKNVLAQTVPMEPEMIKNADGSKELGHWCANFSKLDNEELVEHKAYVMQSDGTFRLIDKMYDSKPSVSSFQGYFSVSEPIGTLFKMKFVKTENGEETGEETDFPADLFYSDCDIDDATGISAMLNDKGQMINDNAVYDLQGRKLSNSKLSNGLYIINGKKMILK